MNIVDDILKYGSTEQVPVPAKVDDDIKSKLSACKFDLSRRPKSVEFLLSAVVEGVEYGVGARGMLGVVSGVAKSRKTTFLSAVVASALADKDVVNMRLRPGGKVVFFDTEQPDYFFYHTQRRAHQLAGLITNVDWYGAFALRDFDPMARVKAIEAVLQQEAPTCAIIDGVLDLVYDMNDLREAQAIAQMLMRWTKEFDCLIMIVLHRNEGLSGRSKMAGHLGSVITRKADFEIMLDRNEQTGYTQVKHRPSRVRRFPTFQFTQNSQGFPVLDSSETIDVTPIEQVP
ncbi:MAG: hypothetical protein D6712_11695, partial [Chloroflexi bacterium]